MSDPEFSVGIGPFQVRPTGKEAIREGGWALRFLLVTCGLVRLSYPLVLVYLALIERDVVLQAFRRFIAAF